MLFRRRLPFGPRLAWLCACLIACGSVHAQVVRETGTPIVPTATQLLDWAETAYPAYFPGHRADLVLSPYIYRYYPQTGNYAGVSGSDVYIWGPVSANAPAPVMVGTLADFACQVQPQPCGTKATHRVQVAGLEREFIVYQPYKAVASAPAVIMIHGTSGDGERYFNISGWREVADREGLIAVFPSALVHCFFEDEDRDGVIESSERQVTTKWAAGTLGVEGARPLCTAADLAQLSAERRALADHPLADDMAFFRSIVESLRTQYPTDMSRVYVSGFSNGAEMSARLATEESTTYAAAAVNASSLHVPAVPAPRAMSVVLAIGEIDPGIAAELGYSTGIPLDGSVADNPTFRANMVTPFTTVLRLDPAVHSYQPVQRYGTRLSQVVYSSSTAGLANTLRTVIIEGADHQYPNGANHPVKMAELLWEFFREQRLP